MPLTELHEQAEIAMFTPQERLSYEESLKDYRDIYSVMKTQFEKGQAKGRAEGKIDIATSMKDDGLSLELISKYTGLSEEEIKKL